MFAGAAFTDQADIKTDEAVDMLVALGVINGYTDGSFKPNDTVTRAEMAKMIYVVRTGKSDASAYNDDKTTFTDINGHWARGYVKYCQSLGVIAGKSATKFDPDATVKTAEAAKMLLVTLGYNADKAGLVGVNWASKTSALADENGLLKDVASGFTAACPRQYAAQLIYNTIFANTVSLRDGEYTKYGYDNSENKTVGEKYMDLKKLSAGILLGCDEVEGKDYYTIKTTTGTYNKVPTDVSNLMGQEVKVLRKDSNDSDKNTVYGVYADKDSKVLATGFVSGLETDGNKIKLDGTSYKFDNGYSLDTAMVYNLNTDVKAVSLKSLADAADKANVTPTVAASKIKLIDNDGNGKVDAAIKTPVQVAKVTSVSKTSFSVKYLTKGVSNKTIDFDDAESYDGLKKDDFVTIIDDANRASDKSLVEKLDVVSTKVTSTRTNEAKTTDSDWYKLAVIDSNNKHVSVTSGNEYDLVIVGGVIVDADETAASTSTVAYIADVKDKAETTLGSKDITWKVGIYFQDGTNNEVKVSKIGGTKLKDVKSYTTVMAGLKQQLVTYSKLSDGTYDVKLVGDNNKVGMDWTENVAYSTSSKVTKNSTVYAVQKIGNKSVADDAYVFVETKKEVKVLTGKQINNWSDTVKANFMSNGMLTKDSNGIAYVKFATLIANNDDVKVPGASKDTLYAYVVSDAYTTDVDGEDKAAYDVWTGTEAKTLIEDASAPTVAAKAGDVISYSENGKYADDIKPVGAESAITGYDKGNVTYAVKVNGKIANYTYELDDDCVFIAVNDDKNEGMEGSKDGVTTANEKTVSKVDYYVTNAYIVLNDDGDKIIAIIYDADDGKLDPETLFAK